MTSITRTGSTGSTGGTDGTGRAGLSQEPTTPMYAGTCPDVVIAGADLPAVVVAYIGTELWCGLDLGHCDRWSEHEDPGCTSQCLEQAGCYPTLEANYDADDLTADSIAAIVADCRAFLESVAEEGLDLTVGMWADPDMIGHDFSLTRNGHGAGFWDRYGDGPLAQLGDALTALAEPYGETTYQDRGDGCLHLA